MIDLNKLQQEDGDAHLDGKTVFPTGSIGAPGSRADDKRLRPHFGLGRNRRTRKHLYRLYRFPLLHAVTCYQMTANEQPKSTRRLRTSRSNGAGGKKVKQDFSVDRGEAGAFRIKNSSLIIQNSNKRLKQQTKFGGGGQKNKKFRGSICSARSPNSRIVMCSIGRNTPWRSPFPVLAPETSRNRPP